MKKAFCDEWCRLLRSGEIEQGQGYLCKDEKRCCLGVAYLVDDAGAVIKKVNGKIYFDNCPGWPTKAHAEKWGILSTDVTELAGMNDRGDTFKQIANYIEANIPVEDSIETTK